MQSIVDVDSDLIIHHDVANEANDSQLLHPMSGFGFAKDQYSLVAILQDLMTGC